jgi:hypothetical protein
MLIGADVSITRPSERGTQVMLTIPIEHSQPR